MDWNEVLEAAAATVMYAGVAGLLAVGSLALLTRSFRSRWLDSRRWWLLPPSLCAITALGVGAALLINRDDARIRADCKEYRFTRKAWESDRVADRLQAADGIARCNAFAGLHEGGVDNRLGPPDERARDDSGRRFLSFDVALDRQDGYEYPYSLVVRFDEGRVVEVEFP